MKVVIVLYALISARAYAASINTGSVEADYETIVVGLGAAGTTAAATLTQAGVRVLALEAMDRVGGRVHTVPFGGGVVEMGAEWIHGTSPSRTYDLATKNGVKLIEQDENTEVYSSDGSRANSSLISELVIQAVGAINEHSDVNESIGEFLTRKLKEYLKEHYPDVLQDKEFLAEVFNLLDQGIGSNEGSSSWNDVTTKGQYQELNGHQYVSWGRNGYKTLFDILLNKYNNGSGLPSLTINLKSEVIKISYSDDPKQKVSVTTADGAVYTADNVIVTVSLGVLKAKHTELFSQPLPQAKLTAIDKISMGVLGKIIFLFPEHWWGKTEDTICFFWKADDRRNVSDEDAWLLKTSWISTPMGSNNALTFWTSGDTAKMVEAIPEDVVKRKLMSLIRRFMGKDVEIPDPIAMTRTTWFHNPYTRGSYTYDNLLTPQYPTARVDLGAPITDSAGNPRVLFAGEATDPQHFSTVHGATDTGHREATRLLERRSG
ncbi:spermine oxidase-like [Plodia interpunctella]|uniref:spermine oxidase-like n=1 Tax=Plodia interpunctella TaxID=58824 RepID=UPI002368E00C|nr:possible lysine-specific histone demethylase 1-like [Plodia interpunctella]XP_053622903.1 possible lysine-specific histone demethylase 1-like [Plodia interpunctella]